MPTVSLFDADILKEILNQHLDEHVDAIANVVKENNYDGIDIDYESTYLDDKSMGDKSPMSTIKRPAKPATGASK